MAEMLQQQGMQPIEQQTAGGYVVPTSWTQGLAKALQSGLGGYQMGQASREEKDLANRYNSERGAVLSDALRAGSPQPEQGPIVPGDPGVPASQGSQQDVYRRLAASQFPDLQSAGTAGLLDDLRRQRLAQLLGGGGTQAPGATGAAGGSSGPSGPSGMPAGIPPGMNPIAWKLLVDSGDEKAMASAIAEAAKPSNRFLAGRPGAAVFDITGPTPTISAFSPVLEAGVTPTYGQNSEVTGAQSIPGYAAARAGIRGAETSATEGARADLDLVAVPDGKGGTVQMPRSQAVRLLGPQQSPPQAPAAQGITREQAPSDSEAQRRAFELADQGRQVSISAPPQSQLGVANPAAKTGQERMGQHDADRVKDFEEKIPVLTNTEKRLNRLRELTNNDQSYAAAGAEVKVLLNSVGQAFGVKIDPAKTANSEEYLAQVGELLKERLGSKDYGSGNGISNLDLISATVPLPMLSKTPQGRRQIIEAIAQDTQNALANAKAASAHFRKNGSLSGFSYPSEANTRQYGHPSEWTPAKQQRLDELKKKLEAEKGR